jgi:hypothetical protein
MSAAPPEPRETQPEVRTAPIGRRALWAIVAGGAALVVGGIWLVSTLLPGFLTTSETVGETPPEARAGEERRIQATLFYVSPDGDALVQARSSVPYGATPAEQARKLVEAQIAPPPDGSLSAIPSGTTVRQVFLTGSGEAYVDLGPEIVKAHSGGSLNEALAVFAIVNVITVNLPDVTAVQILVDGREVDTLSGHIDLRQPLQKATRWIRK